MTNRRIIGWVAIAAALIICIMGGSDGFDGNQPNTGTQDTIAEAIMFCIAIVCVFAAMLCLLTKED